MIYVVEDDQTILEMMLYTLESTGFKAQGFTHAEQFLKQLAVQMPQLVILDIMLPQTDGITLLKQLKADPKTMSLPIIMATAKTTEYDKVKGLDLGADDYLSKPFSMLEMVSRIRAVLRRTKPHQIIHFGPLSIDKTKHQVLLDQQPLQLSLKEFELLVCLIEHADQVLSRQQLLHLIWGYDFDGETRTVDVHIRFLRQKLKQHSGLIVTIRGVGYKAVYHD